MSQTATVSKHEQEQRKQRLRRHLSRLRNARFLEEELQRPTETEYWQRQTASPHWGVLELDEGERQEVQGQCVVWGLPSRECATLIVHQAVFLLDDERRRHVTYMAIPRVPIQGITISLGSKQVIHLTPDRLPLGNVRNWLHDLRGHLYDKITLLHEQWHDKLRRAICEHVPHRVDVFQCEAGNSRRIAAARKSWAGYALRLVKEDVKQCLNKDQKEGLQRPVTSATEEDEEVGVDEEREKETPPVGGPANWEAHVRPCLASLMETAVDELCLFQEQWRVLGQLTQQHDLVLWQLPKSLAEEHDSTSIGETPAVKRRKTSEEDDDSMVVDSDEVEHDEETFSPDEDSEEAEDDVVSEEEEAEESSESPESESDMDVVDSDDDDE